MNGLRRLEMAKLDKKAAAFDLFDQGAISQPGERQVDLEQMIAFQDSLLAKVSAGDKAGQANWVARAKAGEVMRIC
jgi:hypothetical protein